MQRPAPFALAAAIVLVLLGAQACGTADSPDAGTFSPATRVAPEIETLVERSGVGATIDAMPEAFARHMADGFAARARQFGADETAIAAVRELAPRAYRAEAARSVIGARLGARLTGADVAALMLAQDDAAVAAARDGRRRRDPATDPDGFAAFVASLRGAPLSGARRAVLEALAASPDVDGIADALAADMRRSVVVLADAAAPGRGGDDRWRRANETLAAVREGVERERSTVRDRAVRRLAWAYEDRDLAWLHRLRAHQQAPLSRRFVREVRGGHEQFFRDATHWVAARERRRADRGSL